MPAYATRIDHPSDNRFLLSSLTYASVGNQFIATATLADNETTYGVAFGKHDFIPGDIVEILRASPNDFNGRFKIVEVTDEKTFKFLLLGDPGSNSQSGYYTKIWQTKNMIIENNTIELTPFVSGVTGLPFAMLCLDDGEPVPPYLFARIVIRNNIIRHNNNQAISGDPSVAISLSSCEFALIEGNYINLEGDDLIRYRRSGVVHSFRNQTPSGALVEAVNLDSGMRTQDLSTTIQDAMILSF